MVRIVPVLGACTLALLSCSGQRTGIIVVVHTDLVVGHDIDEITLEVAGPKSEPMDASGSFSADAGTEDALSFPVTMALVSRGGPRGPVTIRAIGSFEGMGRAMDTVESEFERGISGQVDMHLGCGCDCIEGERCLENRCVTSEDPVELTLVDEELSREASWCNCSGDIDGDGSVDGSDIVAAVDCVRAIDLNCDQADLDCDGDIDACDVERTVAHFRGDPRACHASYCGSCCSADGCVQTGQEDCEDTRAGTFSACGRCDETSCTGT